MRAAKANLAAWLIGGVCCIGAASAQAGDELLVESPLSGVMQIYSLSTVGGELRPLTQGQRDSSSGAWSPDGNQIAFISTRDGSPQVYVMNADGTAQRRVSELGKYANSPVWSPDGQRLAFSSLSPQRNDILVATLENGELRALTREPTDAAQLAWAPDGSEILYTQLAPGSRSSGRLYAIEADSGAVRLVLEDKGAIISKPAWSPDSSRIAYARAAGRDGINVHVVQRDGSGMRALTEGKLISTAPVWSPDGKWISFESNSHSTERMDVFVLPAAGGAAKNLSDDPQEDFGVNWAKDSASLYFVSFRTGTSQLFQATLEGAVSRVVNSSAHLGSAAVRPRQASQTAALSTVARP